MNPPQTLPFLPAPLPPQLLAPALAGSLLQSDNNDEDIKEEEDFNIERDDYMWGGGIKNRSSPRPGYV